MINSPHLSPHTASIHILDDDSLLNVFYLYRPFLLGEDDEDSARLGGGKVGWVRGRWWYKLAHVCRRWRNLLLASATYLDICLICTKDTPIANMLAHSPPLPLIIDHVYGDVGISEEDEEKIRFALKQCDRVHRIRLQMAVPNLQKLILAMDKNFPLLEHLIIMVPSEDKSTIMTLPKTLQAPRLRHLALIGFVLPMQPQSFTASASLVTLALVMTDPSTYFQPDTLLQLLSLTPQLETLAIIFSFPDFHDDTEIHTQLSYMPIMTHVTLPNLRLFGFRGISTFTELLVRWITTPRLEKLEFDFFKLDTISVSSLLQFIDTLNNLRFDSAKFDFLEERVRVVFYPREEAEMFALSINVDWWFLDFQVSSVAQIFNTLSQTFFAVEHLTLEHGNYIRLVDVDNEVKWRKILRSFGNTKTLYVDDGFVEELSRCLRLDDGERPEELLPELQELTYRCSSTNALFTSFIDARQNAGRPVNLVRRSPSPSPLEPFFDTPIFTSASGESGDGFDT